MNRRYTVGFDNPMMTGYVRHWPKARAVERAEQIVSEMGGSAVVARLDRHGVLQVVHEAYSQRPVA